MQGFPLRKWWAVQIVLPDARIPRGAALLFTRLIDGHNKKTNRCILSWKRLFRDLGVDEHTIRNWRRGLKSSTSPPGVNSGAHDTIGLNPFGHPPRQRAEKRHQKRRRMSISKPNARAVA